MAKETKSKTSRSRSCKAPDGNNKAKASTLASRASKRPDDVDGVGASTPEKPSADSHRLSHAAFKKDEWKYAVEVKIEASSTAISGIAERLAKIFPTASWNTDYEILTLLTSVKKPSPSRLAEVKKVVEERRGAIKRVAIAVVEYFGDF